MKSWTMRVKKRISSMMMVSKDLFKGLLYDLFRAFGIAAAFVLLVMIVAIITEVMR